MQSQNGVGQSPFMLLRSRNQGAPWITWTRPGWVWVSFIANMTLEPASYALKMSHWVASNPSSSDDVSVMRMFWGCEGLGSVQAHPDGSGGVYNVIAPSTSVTLTASALGDAATMPADVEW